MSGRTARATRAAAKQRHDDINKALDRIYRQVPDVGCKGLCSAACTWIAMADVERDRIERRHGIRLEDRDVIEVAPGTFRCKALTQDQKCSVYADRPMICRLWGADESLPCPHGCTPSVAPMPSLEAMLLLREVLILDGDRPMVPVDMMRKVLSHPRGISLWKRMVAANGRGDQDASIEFINLVEELSDQDTQAGPRDAR